MRSEDRGIRPGAATTRIVACAFLLTTAVTVFFAVKWQIGDMFARLTDPADENAVAIADTAIAFAPSDPYASALRAEIGNDPLSEDSRTAVEIAEQTVRLAPSDHRWHIALARALADDEQIERAEAEFNRAIELAPTYAVCRWFYGNFLLRQGRADDAIAQFRTAAAQNWDYRQQVFSVLWDVGGKSEQMLASVAGEGVDNRAHLALFLASRGDAAGALLIWRELPEEGKERHREIADVIAVGLFDQKHFPEALEFSQEVGRDLEAKIGSVTNGSFESALDSANEKSAFGWRISRSDPKLDIGLDNRVAHGGSRSLRLNFKGIAKAEFSNVEQYVAVESNTRYRFSAWVRTENLRAAAGPMIDIVDANSLASIGRTKTFVNGTNSWEQMVVDFTTPSGCKGVLIRTIRASCGGDDCPITGLIWYDDLELAPVK